MKAIVVFEKGARLRFIGHLDLLRFMQRALTRSDLPVCYSQGFNPHLLLSFAAPLSVGLAGRREVMDVPLSAPMEGPLFTDRLNAVLPSGVRILSARLVGDEHPSSMALCGAAQYEAQPQKPCPELNEALKSFLELPEIPFLKKTKSGLKTLDLKPLIYNLFWKEGRLQMTLALSEAGTAKPDELLRALCAHAQVESPGFDIARTRLLTAGLSPLEDA